MCRNLVNGIDWLVGVASTVIFINTVDLISFWGLREIGIKWVAVLSVYIHEKRTEISHESCYIIFTGGLGLGLSATHF